MFVLEVKREGCTHTYEFDDVEVARKHAINIFNRNPEVIDVKVSEKNKTFFSKSV